MFKIFFISSILSIALFSQSFAITPPKPIVGQAFLIGKTTNFQAGEYTFIFALPSGWGLGSCETSQDGSGSFQLFPANKGVGCTITIERTDDPMRSLEKIRKKFPSAKDVNGIFEVEFSKAFFCCQVTQDHVIQIWYSLPKKNKEHAKIWKSLRRCLTISHDVPTNLDKPSELGNERQPVTKLSPYNWVFYHPTENICIWFDTDLRFHCTPNSDNSASYLLEFDESYSTGYIFVKWNQMTVSHDKSAFEDQEPYQQYLKEMMQEIMLIEPSQEFAKDVDKTSYWVEYGVEEAYTIFNGTPYTIVIRAGNGFLIGIALKKKFSGPGINDIFNFINDEILNRFSWD